ncbi:MAG TPA: Hpt domain-containing protein [Burkholderiaceae bacterium]|jgi:chemosensory pili system protein ChpA (sensor histidine kinase/response regulator)
MDPMDSRDIARDSEFPADLSPLAWVQEELRRSLESVHKTLRRQLREGDNRASNFGGDIGTAAPLQAAVAQLHQVAGVLALVGMPAGATVLRAAEYAVDTLARSPGNVEPHVVELIERADFALMAHIARLLAGNQASPLALFPGYRELQAYNGAERIHPADLWTHEWRWIDLPTDDSAEPQAASAMRAPFEATLLKQMRDPSHAHAQHLSNLCANLAASLKGQPHSRTLWQLAAAVMEAQAQDLLPVDAYTKRLGSRLLSQLRAVGQGDAGLAAGSNNQGDRLAQDLLFFCSQARRDSQAPRLNAVRAAYGLQDEDRGNYEDNSLGRIDPNWVAQARRRVTVAKDSWSSAAEGDTHRLAGLDEQFAGLAESLAKLFPSGDVLGQTLQRAVVATLRGGKAPPPALAMEIATSILYVEAALDDAAFDQPEQADRCKRMAARVDAVAHGEPPEPLEAWMEDLYRRVSDRQTMGSVVHELRASLSEVEKQADAYFRDTSKRESLIPVPNQLQAMRGVLSVLGLGQAAQACLRMRDEFDDLANTEVDASLAGPREIFDRLANNLGALGFMINMLSVQPALAKRMFRFDDSTGRLEAVMGRHADAVPTLDLPVVGEELSLDTGSDVHQALDLPDLPSLDLAPPPAPAPILKPMPAPVPVSSAAADPEMQEIFLEEATEVVGNARAAIEALRAEPGNFEQLTNLRRAFHTLKGSSRMVGFNEYGEGAWACEQVLNARVAEASPQADASLLAFCTEAIDYLDRWTDKIAGRGEGEFGPEPLRESADALRLQGELRPLGAAPAKAEPAIESLNEPVVEALPEPLIESVLEMPTLADVPEIVAMPDMIDMPELVEPTAAPEVIEMPAESAFGEREPTMILDMPAAAPDHHEHAERTFAATELTDHLEPTFAITELSPADHLKPEIPHDELPSFKLRLDLDEEPVPAIKSEAIPPLDLPTEPAELMDMAGLADLPTVIEPRTQPPVLEVVAPAEPEAAVEPEAESEEAVKVIGPLRISITLFNIFLNEADEISRRLSTSLAEWALELNQTVPASAESHAHALAGNAATVGYEDLSTLARALEHALARGQRASRYAEADAGAFVRAGEDIRHLLHQFAAGFLKPADAELIEQLNSYEPEVIEEPMTTSHGDLGEETAATALDAIQPEALIQVETVVPSADADEPEPGLPDQIEPELFGFFEEEATDLLEQLHGVLREWLASPTGQGGAACMRVLHTFKGGARLSGAMRLGEQAHDMESEVEHLLRADGAPQPGQLMHLQDLGDALETSFQQLCVLVHSPAAAVVPAAPAPVPVAPVVAAPAVAAPEPAPAPAPVAEPVAELVPEPQPEPEITPEPEALPEPEPEPAVEAIAEVPVPVEVPEPVVAPAPTPPPVQAVTTQIDWSRFSDTASDEGGADVNTVGLQALLRVRASLLERMAAQAGEVSIRRSRLESELAQMKTSLLDLDDNLERLRGQLRELELQAEAQMGKQQDAAQHAGKDFDPLEFDRYTRFTELTRMLAESVGDVATVQRSLQRNVQLGEDELAAQSRLTRELQDDLLRTRMVEFDSLGERMHRVVRQAARDAGCQARLEIVGGQTELDRSVLERMAGAFEHLLRNSVSHGVEPADKRTAAGKDPIGTLKLTVSQAGNEILLDFADDGAGLNVERIRQRGLEKGLIQPGEDPDEATLMNLIFAPGFSTASQVTELSGRGVGMDVVRAEVSTLGGSIETRSTPGKGASFLLRLPLTTALTQVVLLRAGEQVVAVPASLMDSVLRLPHDQVDSARQSGQIEIAGHRQPIYELGGLLGHADSGHHVHHGKTQPVVLVRSAQHRLALQVDEVLGNQEVVVKNLGPQLNKVPGLAGISLLASGDVALIYNPVALADWYGLVALARVANRSPDAPVVAEPAVPEAPLVLVVDDSLTVRRATQRLLEREHYRVMLAKDGLDAMEKLAGEELPAVVLSDIEMPRMDGFDLVRNMRADQRLAGLPVIMITSRIAQKHREYAGQLGVDHYLGKPYDEDQLLQLVARYTAVQSAGAT